MKFPLRLSAVLAFTVACALPVKAGVRQGYIQPQIHNHHYDYADWHYEDYTDRATGQRFHRATKRADQPARTDNGTFAARLSLRMTPDLHLQLGTVQNGGRSLVDCSTSCVVTMQFDDDDPVQVKGSPVTNPSNVALEPAQDLVDRIKAAREVKITAPLRSAGPVTFDFATSDLEWPRDDKQGETKSTEDHGEDSNTQGTPPE